MAVVVITPPAPLVSLALGKAHLRVEGDDQDALIGAFIASVSAHIDGPEGWLGRSIGLQTLEARFDRFDCDLIRLPYGPVIDIVSITYDDEAGVEQTVAADVYTVDGTGPLIGHGGAWPTARLRAGSVRVRYRAGSVADPSADPVVSRTPPPIEAAVLLMLGDLYANRETVVIGAAAAAIPMSTTVENLLAPYRVWSS